MCVHVYVQSLVQKILTEHWKLDLPNRPSTATDDRVQGTSHIKDTLM